MFALLLVVQRAVKLLCCKLFVLSLLLFNSCLPLRVQSGELRSLSGMRPAPC